MSPSKWTPKRLSAHCSSKSIILRSKTPCSPDIASCLHTSSGFGSPLGTRTVRLPTLQRAPPIPARLTQVEPPDKDWQFLLFAAEPYETIGFKIPNQEIDKNPTKFFTSWDDENKVFTLQLYFRAGDGRNRPSAPSLLQPGMPSAPPTA